MTDQKNYTLYKCKYHTQEQDMLIITRCHECEWIYNKDSDKSQEIPEHEIRLWKLQDKIPLTMVKNEMNTKYNVNDMIKTFMALMESKYAFNYNTVMDYTTKISNMVNTFNDIDMVYIKLLEQCDEYHISKHHMTYAYNKIVNRSINAVVKELRNELYNELMR